MPFTPEELRTIKNHMPHVINQARLFVNIADASAGEEEPMYNYLLAMINHMEDELNEVKDLVQAKL